MNVKAPDLHRGDKILADAGNGLEEGIVFGFHPWIVTADMLVDFPWGRFPIVVGEDSEFELLEKAASS